LLGGYPFSAVAFLAEKLQGEVDALNLAEPSLGFGAGAPLEQACFEFIKTRQHRRAYGQHRAAVGSWPGSMAARSVRGTWALNRPA